MTSPSPIPIPPALRPLIRPTWSPVLADGEGRPTGSRFGGRPWLPAGESWPLCPNCGRGLQLFVQLDLGDVPGEPPIAQQGLLQLFYCTSSEPLCEVDLESFSPFGRSVVARRVAGSGPGALGEPAGIEACH